MNISVSGGIERQSDAPTAFAGQISWERLVGVFRVAGEIKDTERVIHVQVHDWGLTFYVETV